MSDKQQKSYLVEQCVSHGILKNAEEADLMTTAELQKVLNDKRVLTISSRQAASSNRTSNRSSNVRQQTVDKPIRRSAKSVNKSGRSIIDDEDSFHTLVLNGTMRMNDTDMINMINQRGGLHKFSGMMSKIFDICRSANRSYNTQFDILANDDRGMIVLPGYDDSDMKSIVLDLDRLNTELRNAMSVLENATKAVSSVIDMRSRAHNQISTPYIKERTAKLRVLFDSLQTLHATMMDTNTRHVKSFEKVKETIDEYDEDEYDSSEDDE